MNQLMALPTWDDRSPAWVDDQLVLTTAVVHRIGTSAASTRRPRLGRRALALGGTGSRLRRADLMLHLSEIHRVTGRAVRSAESCTRPPACSVCTSCRRRSSTRWRWSPVTPSSVWARWPTGKAGPTTARPLLSHAWSHGGDSIPHLWSLVNHALVLTDDGDHEAALAFEDSAIELADRLGAGWPARRPRQPACVQRGPRSARRASRRDRTTAGPAPRRRLPTPVRSAVEHFACVRSTWVTAGPARCCRRRVAERGAGVRAWPSTRPPSTADAAARSPSLGNACWTQCRDRQSRGTSPSRLLVHRVGFRRSASAGCDGRGFRVSVR